MTFTRDVTLVIIALHKMGVMRAVGYFLFSREHHGKYSLWKSEQQTEEEIIEAAKIVRAPLSLSRS